MLGVNRTMSGIFYCKATNGIGNEKKASVKVDVQCKCSNVCPLFDHQFPTRIQK